MKKLPARFSNRKAFFMFGVMFGVLLGIIYGFVLVNNWSQTHIVKTGFPVKISFHSPIWVEEIATPSAYVAKAEAKVEDTVVKKEPKGEVEQLIKTLWGDKWEEALAVISCENATMKMNRVNYNYDGTADFGPFQVNSLHAKRFGTAYQTDILENIKVGYVLYREQGWNPWYSSETCWRKKL